MPTINLSAIDFTPQRVARFWRKVDIREPTACWPWKSGLSDKGYGRLRILGHELIASRLALYLHTGEDPGELLACHTCDNPPCCNPAHLFKGTHADNTQDARQKGRFPTGDRHYARREPERLSRGDAHYTRRQPERVARGARSGAAVLTEAHVREARQRRADSGESYYTLAARYAVDVQTIRRAVLGITWKHL